MGIRFIKPRYTKWTGKRLLQVRVSSWTELKTLEEKIFKDPSWVFRGQAKSSWSLDSTLDRMIKKGMDVSALSEQKAIHAFRVRAGSKINQQLRAIDVLAYMQHYGAPTRLLDFTWRWNIALWFALEEERKTKSCSVWALNLRTVIEKSNVLYKNISDEAADIASQMRDQIDDDNAFSTSREMLIDDAFEDGFDFSKRARFLADKILSGGVKDASGILPITWDGQGSNDRMKAQSALFVMPLGLDGFATNLAGALELPVSLKSDCSLTVDQFGKMMHSCGRHADLVKIVIDNSCREQVLTELGQAGIRADTIYPDLVGVAKSITY